MNKVPRENFMQIWLERLVNRVVTCRRAVGTCFPRMAIHGTSSCVTRQGIRNKLALVSKSFLQSQCSKMYRLTYKCYFKIFRRWQPKPLCRREWTSAAYTRHNIDCVRRVQAPHVMTVISGKWRPCFRKLNFVHIRALHRLIFCLKRRRYLLILI